MSEYKAAVQAVSMALARLCPDHDGPRSESDADVAELLIPALPVLEGMAEALEALEMDATGMRETIENARENYAMICRQLKAARDCDDRHIGQRDAARVALGHAVQIIEQLIPEESARGVANVVLHEARAALAAAQRSEGEK